jgi:hypothetical protein
MLTREREIGILTIDNPPVNAPTPWRVGPSRPCAPSIVPLALCETRGFAGPARFFLSCFQGQPPPQSWLQNSHSYPSSSQDGRR